jgi:hypothetical protein
MDNRQWSIGTKIGTLDAGGELTKTVGTDINTCVGFNILDYSFDEEVADSEYDVDLGLRSNSALMDWHIFDGPFCITNGILSVDNEIELETVTNQNVVIGDNTYTPAQVGTLSDRVDVNGAAPYIGIGWGNLIGRDRRWGFYSDFGVAFADSPDVVLRANGTPAADPAFQADLAKEAKDITEDLEDFEVYPVISVGLCFLF